MRTAIYIEDGIVQLVLTPENDFEKDSIKIFNDKPLEAMMYSGHFAECKAGYMRQYNNEGFESLMLKISQEKK